MKIYRSFVIVSCFLLLGCGQNMPQYQGNGYTINYPQDWVVSTEDKSVLVTVSHASRSLKRVDGTLTVSMQALGNDDFLALQKANEETLKNNSINQNFQSEKVKINNQDTLLWKYERMGADNEKNFFRQALVLNQTAIYTITAIGEDSVAVADLESAVKSFSITN